LTQTERVTHSHREITHAEFIGVGNGNLRQVAGVLNLQQCDIALIVAADKLCVELTAIIKLNADFLRLINNVVIGQT
jgi:hypothetical protein